MSADNPEGRLGRLYEQVQTQARQMVAMQREINRLTNVVVAMTENMGRLIAVVEKQVRQP